MLSYNVDEMGVSLADRKIKLVTANNGVRRPMVNTGHITLVLCSCADGSQMTPTFIWQSSELNEVATATSEHDAFEAATSTGYITTELFAEWFRKFVEHVIGVC
jgi:hypothetical protein